MESLRRRSASTTLLPSVLLSYLRQAIFREMETSAGHHPTSATSQPADARLLVMTGHHQQPAGSWLRSLSTRYVQSSRSNGPCRLPKLPGSGSSSSYLHQQDNNNKQAAKLLSRVVLPPLRQSSPSSSSSSSVISSSPGSWLLPTVQRKQLYRPTKSHRDFVMNGIPSPASNPAISSSYSDEHSTTKLHQQQVSAGKVGRLLPLLTPSPHLDDSDEDGYQQEEEEDGGENVRKEEEEPGGTTMELMPVHVGTGHHHHLAVGDDVFTLQGLPPSLTSRDPSAAVAKAPSSAPQEAVIQWASNDWTDGRPGIDPRRPHDHRLTTITTTTIGGTTDLDGMAATSQQQQQRPVWPFGSNSAGRVRHSPPSTPVVCHSSRAHTAGPSMSEEDDVIERIDPAAILTEELLDLTTSTDEAEDASITSFYRLERNEDGTEMNGYEFPYGGKPALLLVDEEPYGVSMEQLKKLLRPARNNNEEEDEEGKEPIRITSSYRWQPSDRRSVVTKDRPPIPNAVHPVDDEEEEEDFVLNADDRPINGIARKAAGEEEEEEDGMRIGSQKKSQSVGVPDYSSSSSPSDDGLMRGRQRSLPTRRANDFDAVKSPGLAQVPKRASVQVPYNNSTASRRSPAARAALRDSSTGPSSKQSAASSVKTSPLSSESSHQDPRGRLQAALRSINSSDWEDKVDGIRRLDELVASTNGESVASDIHTVALALLVEVQNLRSQVSRVAIQSMGNLFQHCGKYMEQDLDRAVRLLLSKSGDTNRFIREDAHAALMAVTQHVQPARAIVAIVTEGLSHKNAAVRAEAAKLLAAIVVDRLGPAKSLSGAKDVTERILPAAAHFIQDGSLEARAQAKRIFSVLLQDPALFDKALQKYVTPSIIRNIQRSLDQLRSNTHTKNP